MNIMENAFLKAQKKLKEKIRKVEAIKPIKKRKKRRTRFKVAFSGQKGAGDNIFYTCKDCSEPVGHKEVVITFEKVLTGMQKEQDKYRLIEWERLEEPSGVRQIEDIMEGSFKQIERLADIRFNLLIKL